MRPLIIGLALALTPTLGLIGCADKTVTQKPVHKDLTVDEIRTKLQKGSFRDKLEAKKQISKLPVAERLTVLTALAKDEDKSTRMIAVQSLLKMLPNDDAQATLFGISAADPDPKIREMVLAKIAPPPPPPAPAPNGAETPAAE